MSSSYPLTRFLQRYVVPKSIVAMYYSLRYRCYVSTRTHIQLSGLITFGASTVVKPYVVITTQTGRIAFGRQCAISSFTHISGGSEGIVAGDYVRMGPNVTIVGGSHNFSRRDLLIVEQGSHSGRVTIGDDVLVGAGAIILPGITVGEGAVIGAGSVVKEDVPAYAVVAGVPARVIGQRE